MLKVSKNTLSVTQLVRFGVLSRSRIIPSRGGRAHGYAPQGFLVHGGQPVLWTAYLNGGSVPRGSGFVRTVRDLAHRAGVDPTPLERPVQRDRRADLLDDFFVLCRQELAGPNGSNGRAYLEWRGLPPDAIERSRLGIVPQKTRTRAALNEAGYTESEIAESNLLADTRWPGRLCGAWRDQSGRTRMLWARALNNDPPPDPRYLYLRGASRVNLPPYGFSDVLAAPSAARRDLILVEGLFDLHQLRAHRVETVAALGGLSISPSMFERLSHVGVEKVTLCLDHDEAGRSATARAVEHAAQARRSPTIHVVDPERLAPADDPDSLIRDRGVDAWRAALEACECGITWRAGQFLVGVTPDSSQVMRREALGRAGSWLGTLPSRLALEQEDAIRTSAERSAYSPDATARAFRARFWREPSLERPPGRTSRTL